MKNKVFILYSLIVPIIYILLVPINYIFGTSASDILSRPYGKISDIISFFITVTYFGLGIGNIVLFCLNDKKKKIKNILILLANTIWGYLMLGAAFTAWVLVGLAIAFVAGGFLIVIGYLVLYIKQIIELIKIYKESSQEL